MKVNILEKICYQATIGYCWMVILEKFKIRYYMH